MSTEGQRLHDLRENKGYSMQDLADKIGVHKGTIFKWEHGQTPLKRAASESLKKLAVALGTSSDYLEGRTDDPSPKESITENDIERRGEAYLQKHLLQSERMKSFALDVMAAQSGYHIDYTPDGDVLLGCGSGTTVEITESDVKELASRLNSYAAFLLKELEEKKA